MMREFMELLLQIMGNNWSLVLRISIKLKLDLNIKRKIKFWTLH